jgi:hypothetical protein
MYIKDVISNGVQKKYACQNYISYYWHPTRQLGNVCVCVCVWEANPHSTGTLLSS